MRSEQNMRINQLETVDTMYNSFSFHPVKIITTCEGGMCLTNDPELAIDKSL